MCLLCQDLLSFKSKLQGGIGRYTLSPWATKRRKTHLKTKNNQNCQIIELYGSPTTKGLKKKRSFGLVGENAQQGRGWRIGQVVQQAGGMGSSTFVCKQTRGNNRGVRRTTQPRVPGQGNKASQFLAVKTCGGCGSKRNSPGKVVRETHRVLECTQTHPPRNQHLMGPICLWVVGEVTES